MGRIILIVIVVFSIISLFWYVNTKASSGEVVNNNPPFTNLNTCIQYCQDNFCSVDIENNVSCPDRGFSSCQNNCKLKYNK